MKAHRLNLREAAMPSLELELMDGTIINVLPCKPSQVQELQSFATKMSEISADENSDNATYIAAAYDFFAEILSVNKEKMTFTADQLRDTYLFLPVDKDSKNPEKDKEFNELMAITTVMKSIVEFLADLKTSKNS